MSDSCRHFSERREIFSEFDSLLQVDDLGQVRQKADGSFDLAVGVCDGRKVDSNPLVTRTHGYIELDAGKDFSRTEALADELLQGRRFTDQIRKGEAFFQRPFKNSIAGRIV